MVGNTKLVLASVTVLLLVFSFVRINDGLTKVLSNIVGIEEFKQGQLAQKHASGVGTFGQRAIKKSKGVVANVTRKFFEPSLSSKISTALPRSVRKELAFDQSSRMFQDSFLTAGILTQYFNQLAFAFAATLPAAVLAALAAYLLAAFEQALAFLGRSTSARLSILPFDVIPYILWVFPMTSVARWIYSTQPETDGVFYQFVISDYWQFSSHFIYQFLIYFGFSMFLFIFMYRQNYVLLRENILIIESERLQNNLLSTVLLLKSRLENILPPA